MKVKDIINSQIDFAFAGDTKVNFVVKPKGTGKEYFCEESFWLRNYPEVAEMEVKNWMILDARRNECKFLIIVERDEEYEKKKEERWKNLIGK